jgi:hypothetical protein
MTFILDLISFTIEGYKIEKMGLGVWGVGADFKGPNKKYTGRILNLSNLEIPKARW